MAAAPKRPPLPASALRGDDPCTEAEFRRQINLAHEEGAELAVMEDRAEFPVAAGGRAEDRLERDLTRLERTEDRGRYDAEGRVFH